MKARSREIRRRFQTGSEGGKTYPPIKTKNRPSGQKNKQEQEQIMNQSRVHDIISTKTQTSFAPANAATARPIRQGRTFVRGLLPKASALALLLGFSLGSSLLKAGEEPQYQFIAIPLPGAGVTGGFAVGINDEGLATGFYNDPVTGDWFSFLLQDSKLKTGISAPGATVTAMGPANNFGVESGNFGSESNQQAGFYDIRRGTFTPLPEIPGLPFTFGDGVNDFGHATGVSYPSGSFTVGGNGLGTNWIWDGREYSFFDVPGAVNGTSVGGINDWDQVTGLFFGSSGLPQGFVKDGPNYTILNVPGALYTLAFGINNQGVVAGGYKNPDGSHHGYFWRDGNFVTVDVDLPGAEGTLWYQANGNGDLAGVFYTGPDHVENAVIAVRQYGCGR
jgi:hypothetical protein